MVMGPHSNLKKTCFKIFYFFFASSMYIKKSCKSYFIFCIVMLCTIFGQSFLRFFEWPNPTLCSLYIFIYGTSFHIFILLTCMYTYRCHFFNFFVGRVEIQ